MTKRPETSGGHGPPTVDLEELIEPELLDWYRMSPDERWLRSRTRPGRSPRRARSGAIRARLAQDALWEVVRRGGLELLPLGDADVNRMHELLRKYRDLPMDLAGAGVIGAPLPSI